MPICAAHLVPLLALTCAGVGAAAEEPDRMATLARGWSVLRAMDCARCHGRDYEGWTAPSLLAAVRELPRDRFDRLVLDGDIVRGMPGYRSQPAVAEALDAIHAYLAARARGEIGPGRPQPDRGGPEPVSR